MSLLCNWYQHSSFMWLVVTAWNIKAWDPLGQTTFNFITNINLNTTLYFSGVGIITRCFSHIGSIDSLEYQYIADISPIKLSSRKDTKTSLLLQQRRLQGNMPHNNSPLLEIFQILESCYSHCSENNFPWNIS